MRCTVTHVSMVFGYATLCVAKKNRRKLKFPVEMLHVATGQFEVSVTGGMGGWGVED